MMQVSEDLSFLAQQLYSLQAQRRRCVAYVSAYSHLSIYEVILNPLRTSSDGRGEVLFCRLVNSVLHGRRMVMQPAAASIVCSTLRRWADDSTLHEGGPAASSKDEEDDIDESGDMQLQVEALTALASLVSDNLIQVSSHVTKQ